MKKLKMLVLTDHQAHTPENSFYALTQELRRHPRCESIEVASRSIVYNRPFFYQEIPRSGIYVAPITSNFRYTADGRHFRYRLRRASLREFDVILLRLPHPIAESFWAYLSGQFPDHQIINRPLGIHTTSDKRWLLRVPELCPPIKDCRSVEDILAFKEQFPIVLKPAYNYGGKGVVKIEEETAFVNNQEIPLNKFLDTLEARQEELHFLGMQYLRNVDQGDKRVVVVSGQVLGASLRMPAVGSWLCNVSQGGRSCAAEADEDEQQIARRLSPMLAELGILIYGFDTLVDDRGRRVLSEINTTSIGGFPQIALQSGRPVVQETADLIWQHALEVSLNHPGIAA